MPMYVTSLTARRGRHPFRSVAIGILLLSGLAFGAACSAADSASELDFPCKPTLCVAPDKPEGPPDGVKLCPPGDCNYQAQTGCAPDETCVVHGDSMTGTVYPKCVAAGTQKRGETCDSAHPCGHGLQCIGRGAGPFVCRKLCCAAPDMPYGDWTACDPGESCIRQLEVQLESPPNSKTYVTLEANVDFCVPVNNCDVLDAESCKGDGGDRARPVCRIADPLGNVACQPPGSADLGEPCKRLNQCGPVETCAQTTVMGTGQVENELSCRRLCRLGSCGPEACPKAEGVCVHFERDPEGVGECTPGFNKDKYCHDLDGGVAPAPSGKPATHDAGSRDASASG